MEYVSGSMVPINEINNVWVSLPEKLKICEHDTKYVYKRSDSTSG